MCFSHTHTHTHTHTNTHTDSHKSACIESYIVMRTNSQSNINDWNSRYVWNDDYKVFDHWWEKWGVDKVVPDEPEYESR